MLDLEKKSKEESGIIILAATDAKKITDDLIASVATEVGLTFHTMKRAWYNNQTTLDGRTNKRLKDGTTVTTPKQKEQKLAWQKSYSVRGRKVTAEEAGAIIKEIANPGKKVYEVLFVNDISLGQYYNWIKELYNSGTLLGKTILNPKKYAKVDVLKVVKYCRNPQRFANESILEKTRMQRIATVLNKYL